MGWITRIVLLGLLAWALLTVGARGAEAAVGVTQDSESALWVETTGADANLSATVNRLGPDGAPSTAVTLLAVLQEPNRTLHRTPSLTPGVYDVRVGGTGHIHAVLDPVGLGDLQVLETEIARIQTGLAVFRAELRSLNASVSAGTSQIGAVVENLTAVQANLSRLASQLAGLEQRVDLARVPAGIAMQRDVDAETRRLGDQFAQKSERLQWFIQGMLAAQVATLGALAFLYVQSRRASPLEDAAPARQPAMGGVAQSGLIRRILLSRPRPQRADLSVQALDGPVAEAAPPTPPPAPEPRIPEPVPPPPYPASQAPATEEPSLLVLTPQGGEAGVQ